MPGYSWGVPYRLPSSFQYHGFSIGDTTWWTGSHCRLIRLRRFQLSSACLAVPGCHFNGLASPKQLCFHLSFVISFYAFPFPGSFGHGHSPAGHRSTAACFALRIGGELVRGILVQSRQPLRAHRKPVSQRHRPPCRFGRAAERARPQASPLHEHINSRSPTDGASAEVSGIAAARRYRRGAAACVPLDRRWWRLQTICEQGKGRKRGKCFSRGNGGQQETKFKTGDPFN